METLKIVQFIKFPRLHENMRQKAFEQNPIKFQITNLITANSS